MAKSLKPPSEELDKFLLRMSTGLRDKIKAIADRNGRSMNAEIVARLERSIDFEDEYGSLEAVMIEVWKDIDELKSNVDELGRQVFPHRFDWK